MGTTACAKIPENKNYVSIREAAWRSSMSEKTIRNIIRNDALPHCRKSGSAKIYLRWADFAAWMERRKIVLKRDDGLLGILRGMGKEGQ